MSDRHPFNREDQDRHPVRHPARHVVVVGPMGVGKSTAGRGIANWLDRPYNDSDADIELLLGVSGREFAVDADVGALHRLEAAVLIGALARPVPHVITAAASVVEDEIVRRVLTDKDNAWVVRLDAPVDVIRQRQSTGDHRRRIPIDEMEELAERREPLYAEVEDCRVDARLPPDDIVAQALEAFEKSAPGR